MAEQKRKFSQGTWVSGSTTGGVEFPHGIVCGWDENDGEHYVLLMAAEAADFQREDAHWCNAKDLTATDDLPGWCVGGPTHAFVYEWMDDHVANLSLHAAPQDIIDAYFTDATEDERRTLTTKLMEAVMDPGERIEMVPGGGAVRFCVVNG